MIFVAISALLPSCRLAFLVPFRIDSFSTAFAASVAYAPASSTDSSVLAEAGPQP